MKMKSPIAIISAPRVSASDQSVPVLAYADVMPGDTGASVPALAAGKRFFHKTNGRVILLSSLTSYAAAATATGPRCDRGSRRRIIAAARHHLNMRDDPLARRRRLKLLCRNNRKQYPMSIRPDRAHLSGDRRREASGPAQVESRRIIKTERINKLGRTA